MKTPNKQTRKMPIGSGKVSSALQRAVDLPQLTGMFVLHRREIESGWIPGVDSRLGPETEPEVLSVVAASTIIAVEGYDDDEREIYEIPEVREYFQSQNEIWSPWLFAGSIFTPDLFAIVLACLPTLSCWRSGDQVHVKWEAEEMHAFLQKSLPTAAWLHHRAGVGKEEGCALLKAAAAYIGLPFSEDGR